MANLQNSFDLKYNYSHILIKNSNLTQEEHDEEVGVLDISQNACRVLLFNDDWHTFDEVIEQIIKAINCSFKHAEKLTIEVHEKGKALVFSGDLNECLKVSSILEEIALHTQIEM